MSKKSNLYLVLCGLFITNAVIAEIIGTKIFSVEDTLGIEPIHWQFLGQTLDLNMSAGVINWPLVFIISDIINEYFGKEGVRRISFLTAGLLVYTFGLIYIATALPPAGFWIELFRNENATNNFHIDHAFRLILSQGLGIIIGSLVAFLVGQLLDAYVFHWLRRRTKNRFIWLRATGSTLFSQLIDSFLVIWIAFYVFGKWPLAQVMAVGTINYLYKAAVAILLTPLIYVAHALIDRYLGHKQADYLITQATKSTSSGSEMAEQPD